MEPMTIRCSSLDYLVRCPQSVLGESDVEVSEWHPAATLGHAAHEIVAAHIQGEGLTPKAAAARHSISPDDVPELAELATGCIELWEKLERHVPDPQCEIALESKPIEVKGESYVLSGTADVLSPVGSGDAIVIDWKTGYVDWGYDNQLAGYALCVWQQMGEPDECEITTVTAFARMGFYRTVKWTPDRLREWRDQLVRNTLSKPELYQPGEHCRFCPHRNTCKAHRVMAQHAVDSMIPRDPAEGAASQWVRAIQEFLDDLTPARLEDPDVAEAVEQIRMRAKIAKDAASDAEAMLKEVADRMGYLPCGDDHELVVNRSERRDLNPAQAMRAAQRFMSTDEIADAISVSLTKLCNRYAENAPHGSKGEFKEKLTKALEDAGAITTSEVARLSHRKSKTRKELTDE